MNTKQVFEIQAKPDLTVVRFFGFVDVAMVEECKPAIQKKIPAGTKNFVIDLADVSFLDSHGVGLFVSLLKQAYKNGGHLFLASASGQPASVLDMVGFTGAHVSHVIDADEAAQKLKKMAG
jgi:anti-sigma B factor antagonist